MDYNDPFALPTQPLQSSPVEPDWTRTQEPAAKTDATEGQMSDFSSPDSGNFDEEEEAKRTLKAIVAGVLLLAVISSAGVWYYISRDTQPSEDSTSVPGPVRVPEDGPRDSALILAVTGGKFITRDGFEVDVPPGALKEDTLLSVEKIENGPVTDLFHLKPDGLKFLKPVSLGVPYKTSGLQETETPYDIRLDYWFANRDFARSLEYMLQESARKLRTRVSEF